MVYTTVATLDSAHEDSIWTAAWSSKDDVIVTGAVDGKVKLWKWTGSKIEPKLTWEGHSLGIVSVDISPSGKIAASSSLDGTVAFWDLETLSTTPLSVADLGPMQSWTIKFLADSQRVATGSENGSLNIVNVSDGSKLKSFEAGSKFIFSVAHSPNGKLVASGGVDGIVRVFDTEQDKLVHKIEAHAMPVRALAFSPDSSLLLSGSDDTLIKLHDAQHGTTLFTFSGHSSWITSLAFSPSGLQFSSSSIDKKVRVWDVTTHETLHTFDTHEDQVWSVAYNAKGDRLVSVSSASKIHVHECS